MTVDVGFIRDGLSYDLIAVPEAHYWITCAQAFVVDEIWYDAAAVIDDEDGTYPRPIIQLIEDRASTGRTAWMYFSTPLTETELDDYVRHDVLPLPPPLKGTAYHGNQTR